MPEFQDVTWEQVEAQRQRAQAAEDEVESMKAHVLRVGLEANAFAAELLDIIGGLLNASGHASTDPNLNDCTCDEFVDFVPASNEPATCIHLRALAALMGA